MGVIRKWKSQKQDILFDQDTNMDRGRLQVCRERMQALCSFSELSSEEPGDRGLNLEWFGPVRWPSCSVDVSVPYCPGLLCSLAGTREHSSHGIIRSKHCKIPALKELSGHPLTFLTKAGTPLSPPLVPAMSLTGDPDTEWARVLHPSPSSLRSLKVTVQVIHMHVKNKSQNQHCGHSHGESKGLVSQTWSLGLSLWTLFAM